MRINRSVRCLLLAITVLVISATSFAQIGVSIRIGPPALPVYEQPPCPGDGYLWTPGYWAYDYDAQDYYWVPGTWVLAPQPGFLWTPPWWGWSGGVFLFHEGYWGPHVGFYGGIAYGFGYFGVGFEGGRWEGGHFFYNRSVTNINVTNIHNVYNTTVIHNTVINHVSYNGGNGGVTARPTPQEEAAEHERHVPPVAAQTQHIQEARSNVDLRASRNQGKPPVAATERPGAFKGNGVVHAKEAGAPYHPENNREENNRNEPARPNEGAARPENNVPRPPERSSEPASGAENARPENNVPRPGNTAIHPNDLPAREKPAPSNTGNAKVDKKYDQQQQKLSAKQDQERQKLQQQQDREHQKMSQQKANDAKQQQLEQRHQQQTQQMQQRHEQQQQHLQQKQSAGHKAQPSKEGKG